MLRSIMAQLHYKFELLESEKKEVPFRSHIYVPEIYPTTHYPFQEREDKAHVLKVKIANSQ